MEKIINDFIISKLEHTKILIENGQRTEAISAIKAIEKYEGKSLISIANRYLRRKDKTYGKLALFVGSTTYGSAALELGKIYLREGDNKLAEEAFIRGFHSNHLICGCMVAYMHIKGVAVNSNSVFGNDLLDSIIARDIFINTDLAEKELKECCEHRVLNYSNQESVVTEELIFRRLIRLDHMLARGKTDFAKMAIAKWKMNLPKLAKSYDKQGESGKADYTLAIDATINPTPESSYALAIRFIPKAKAGGCGWEVVTHYLNNGLKGGDKKIKAQSYYCLAQLHLQFLIPEAELKQGKALYRKAKKLDPNGKMEKKVKHIFNKKIF